MELDNEGLEQRCRSMVIALRDRHQWYLLEVDEFVRRTMALTNEDELGAVQHIAVNVYSMALYHACTGAEGDDRRELAFGELWHYLFSYARWRYSDVSQDVVQSALEHICATLDRCRTPITFLAFALQTLMNAARVTRRHIRHEVESLDTWDDEGTPLAAPSMELDARVVAGEQHHAIIHVAKEFYQRHPRAVQQFDALWLKYIEEIDDVAISERLGVSVSAVPVLRARARKRLRTDPTWRDLAKGFGIVPGSV